MKLLSHQDNNDIKAINQELELKRTVNIQKAAEVVRKDLAKANADFNTTMASFKEKWAKEEQVHEERVRQMEAEIVILEEKRKTTDKDKLIELLEEKLSQVGARELELDDREVKLDLREQGLNEQIRMFKATK